MGFFKTITGGVFGIIYLIIGTYLYTILKEKQYPDQPTPANFDVGKYVGQWYEISALPFFWNQDCTCTQPYYGPIPGSDQIHVNNTCRYTYSPEKVTSFIGQAWAVNKDATKLKVVFFWPFAGDYWVLDVAKDYSWAVVGHPTKEYLWIMSRTPDLNEATYKTLIDKCRQLGYPVELMKKTDQNCGSNFPSLKK